MAPHTPAQHSVLWVILAATAALWILLLQATHFNVVTVTLGLLVAVAILG